MMTTLDAYYNLRLARLQAAGSFDAGAQVPARHYSRPVKGGQDDAFYIQREPDRVPGVSVALAAASPFFGGNLERTALLVPPILASLFMIPLFIACWRIGVPAAGLAGGLVATFSIEYFQRTSIGWVDTDALNLFFPWTLSCLILMLHERQRRDTQLLLSAAVGVVLYGFHVWYNKAGLNLLFALALAAHLRFARVTWRSTLLCVLVMIFFANPLQFAGVVPNLEDFFGRYLGPATTPNVDAVSVLEFPNVWSTISEAGHLSWKAMLGRILQRPDLAVLGLVACAPLMVSRWRALAALGPILLLGMMAFMTSRRFLIYLAPFVGMGWGCAIALVGRSLLGKYKPAPSAHIAGHATDDQSPLLAKARRIVGMPEFQSATIYLCVMALFFGVFSPIAARAFVPRPAIPAAVFKDLQELAKKLPENSRIWTWWDLGFAIIDTSGFGVYHDGSAQYTPQTNLVAASFVSTSQSLMHDVIGFVDREGNQGIHQLAKNAADMNALMNRMSGTGRLPGSVPIYVMITPDMLLKYSGMRSLAAVTGRASVGIRWLQCMRIVDERMDCGSQLIDFRSGQIELRRNRDSASVERQALRRAVIVEGGRMVRLRDYSDVGRLTVEMVFESGAVKAAYLLDEAAFESNLNQMFVLGRFDPSRFEEAYNGFPYSRTFRVR